MRYWAMHAEKSLLALLIATMTAVPGAVTADPTDHATAIDCGLPSLQTEEELCYNDFIKETWPHGIMSPDCNLPFFSYNMHQDECGHCMVTESVSLLARYAAEIGDWDTLDQMLNAIAPETGGDQFCDSVVQLLHWRLRHDDCTKRVEENGSLRNAEGEENRLMEAFGLAASACPDPVRQDACREMVRFLAEGMIGIDQVNNVTVPRYLGSFEGHDLVADNRDDYLMQSCIWDPDPNPTAPTTTDLESNLSYIKLVGFRYAAELEDPRLSEFYSKVIEQSIQAIRDSEVGCYPGLYKVMYRMPGGFLMPEIPEFPETREGDDYPPPNLALHGACACSSVQEGNELLYGCGFAFDGDDAWYPTGRRWSSKVADHQWIYVDLGTEQRIDRVKLCWETAYASKYKIQVASTEAQVQNDEWTTIVTEDNGDGGLDDIRFPMQTARFVRMYGIERAEQWGFSLWEFEVYYHNYRYCSSLSALDLAYRTGSYARLAKDARYADLWEMGRQTYEFFKARYLANYPDDPAAADAHAFNEAYDAATGERKEDRPAPLSAFTDLVDLACLFRDYAFASRVLGDVINAGHGVEYYQVDNVGSGYRRAFMRTTGNPQAELWADATAFDNLEMLLSLNSYNSSLGTICAPYFDPPVWDRPCRVGETLAFDVGAKDNDSPPPAITMINGCPGATFHDNGDGTGRFSWTPGADDCGQACTVTFEASDGTYSTTDEASLSVAVCPPAMTIYEAKMLPDGAPTALNGKIVTWINADSFYMEEETRFAGVLVALPGHSVAIGDRVNVGGTLDTDSDGERFVAAYSVEEVGTDLIRPLGFMPPRAGWDSHYWRLPSYTPIAGSIGLGHTGLLVRTWGRVLESDPFSGMLWLQHGCLGMRPFDPVIRCQAQPGVQISPYWRQVQITGVTSRNRFAEGFDILDPNVWLWSPEQKDPEVIGGWLNLYNIVWHGGTPQAQGMEVQSSEEFLYGSLEVFARAEHWRNDTSVGLEKWYADGHYGIVVTHEVPDPENPGGLCINLGVIRQCRADYIAIHGWNQIKKPEGNLFRFEWTSGNVKLYIDDVLRVQYPDPSSSIHESAMVPNVPLRVRLNAGAPPDDPSGEPLDHEDTLYVDRVAIAPEREILVSPLDGIKPAACGFYGLCFGPYLNSAPGPIGEEELRRLLRVTALSTKWVRTYGCLNGLDAVGRLAHELDLRAALCADISRKTEQDVVNSVLEIAKLKQQIADHDMTDGGIGGSHVDMAVVGNDVLCADKMPLADLIGYLSDVRQYIRSNGCFIPVTTGEAWGNLNGLSVDDIEALSTNLDVVAFNCHPFNEEVPIEAAIGHLDSAYRVLKSKYQGKELIVAETGWPDAGTANGQAIPSPENATFYLANAMNWARANGVETFYFEAFDEPWKGPEEFEKHLGIWTNDQKPVMKAGRLDALNCRRPDVVDGPGNPDISITGYPAYGSEGFVIGGAIHIDPNQHQVAVYVKVGGGWYAKPYEVSRGSWINMDGTWGCDICTYPTDVNATEIRAYLLPRSVICPNPKGAAELPPELDAYPHDVVLRSSP